MRASQPFLSLIIPVHKDKIQFGRLLASIVQSTFANFADIEIIVIQDDSYMEVEEVVMEYKKTLPCSIYFYKLGKHFGPAFARNTGAQKARGANLVFLDADVVLKKETLTNAYMFFKRKKGKAFTGIWSKEQQTKKWFPHFKALRDYCYWFIEREKNARYYLFSTRVAGIEKRLFQNIGGFNTSYKLPTVEDIELTYKIEKRAKISFEPTIIVDHEFEDLFILAKKYYLRSRDWIKLYMKRLRFDPVATSRLEAYKSVVAGLLCIFLGLFIVFGVYPLLYLSLMLFLVFLILEYRFLRFLYQEKGLLFTLYSIPTAIFLYLVIDLGSVVGLIEYNIAKLRR